MARGRDDGGAWRDRASVPGFANLMQALWGAWGFLVPWVVVVAVDDARGHACPSENLLSTLSSPPLIQEYVAPVPTTHATWRCAMAWQDCAVRMEEDVPVLGAPEGCRAEEGLPAASPSVGRTVLQYVLPLLCGRNIERVSPKPLPSSM